MDIRVKATHNIFYQIPTAVAAVLVDAGICEQYVAAPAPKPALPEWGLQKRNGRPCIVHNAGAQQALFDGAPAKAATAFQTFCWSVEHQKREMQGPIPPDNVIEAYRKAFEGGGGENFYLWSSSPQGFEK